MTDALVDSADVGQPEFDPRRYLRILWRRKLSFLIVIAIVPTAAYFWSSRSAKIYQSASIIQVESDGTVNIGPLAQASSTGPSQSSIDVTAALVNTPVIAGGAAALLHPPSSDPRSLIGAIVATPNETTGFITLTSSAATPGRAAEVANAFANAVVAFRTHQAVAQIDTAIKQIEAELPSERYAVSRAQLSDQLRTLRALRIGQGSNAVVVESAVANRSPVSPQPARALKLSLLVAVLLALCTVALRESFDRRTRELADVEGVLGLPVLAVIPGAAFRGGSSGADVREAFHTLRANIGYFNVDRPIRSLMVTSPARGEGKTTVAVNLALDMAIAGRKVVLVDADLRHPRVNARLGLGDGPGLGDVVSGKCSLAEALIDYPVAASGAGRGQLLILSAGPPTANPSELLSSRHVGRLISDLEALCDLVIIDTTPVLALSDAIPLMKRVSGLLIVARMKHSNRNALRRLRKVITAGGATPLGTVVTDASFDPEYWGQASVDDPAEADEAPPSDLEISAAGRVEQR